MGFADSIRSNAQKRLAQVNEVVTTRAAELFTEVVNFSPTKPAAQYAKGEFINNWMVGVNGIDTSTRGSRNYDGMASRNDIATLKKVTAFYGKDGKVTLTNNTYYSILIEMKGWPTGKAPYAPVAKAFIKVVPKYKRTP